MKKLFLAIILPLNFIFISCQNKNQERSKRDQIIIDNSIKELKASNLFLGNDDFIINPYCGEFEFNSYTNKFYPQFREDYLESKEEVYSILNLDDSTFALLKSDIDSVYNNSKCYESISQNFSSNESKLLLTFSGIDDDIVFVEIIRMCKPITLEELDGTKSYLKRKREAVISLVLLLKNKEVINVLMDNSISSENQCG